MTKKIACYIFIFLFTQIGFSNPLRPKKKSCYRICIAPVYGFYGINKNHATNTQPKMSAQFNFKHEFGGDRQYKAFFSYGIDYFLHGLNYNSYYFKPDSLQLYNKNFAYQHSLIMQEIALPIQFRYSFLNENNALFSPYVALGYQLRYMLPANLKIAQNGNQIINSAVDVAFKNPLIYKNINSSIFASVGFQKNGINGSKTGFFIELQTKYGFSPYSFYEKYVASSLYINSVHLALNVGVRF